MAVHTDTEADSLRPLVTRVQLRNYRSITSCDVELERLTYFVGPNGSGKSNFLDALRLVADALRFSLDHALRERAGLREVRSRWAEEGALVVIRIEFELHPGSAGHFSVELRERSHGGHEIAREECAFDGVRYVVEDGKVTAAPGPVSPPAAVDRLYLVAASGLPTLRPVFDALSSMGFYNLDPTAMRQPQPPDTGEVLARDGSNIASLIERMRSDDEETLRRLEAYLACVAPGVSGVAGRRVGSVATLEFSQLPAGRDAALNFPAASISDGTVRALGVLAALLQSRARGQVSLVAIEEPELALHPSAVGALRDALQDGVQHSQVLITSHSPELLDDKHIDPASIRVVDQDGGETVIEPLDSSSESLVRERVFTVGELLRSNQLAPERGGRPSVLSHDATQPADL